MLTSGDVARASLTVWCGPLTDVPHLVCWSGVSNDGVDLRIDFRVRAECAYRPDGQYEDPTTREAFAHGSNRKVMRALIHKEFAEMNKEFAETN